jgi:SET domain-containing protein
VAQTTAESGVAARDGLEVGEGRLGRGVFATRSFAKGDVLEICPTLEVPDDDVRGLLGDYAFSTHHEGELVLLLGFGMLYNHSATPNAEYVEHGPRTIAFVALTDVEAGDELTIDYGDEWWETRGLEPE